MSSEKSKAKFLDNLSKEIDKIKIYDLEYYFRTENGVNFIDVNLSGNYSPLKLIVHKHNTPDDALNYTPMDDEDFDVSSFIKESNIDVMLKLFIKDYLILKAQENKHLMGETSNDW